MYRAYSIIGERLPDAWLRYQTSCRYHLPPDIRCAAAADRTDSRQPASDVSGKQCQMVASETARRSAKEGGRRRVSFGQPSDGVKLMHAREASRRRENMHTGLQTSNRVLANARPVAGIQKSWRRAKEYRKRPK